MDPFLEDPAIWPDFHDRLATAMSTELNRILPAPYYARLESRPELGIVAEPGERRRIVPDISVLRGARSDPSSGSVSVATPYPRTEISPSVEIETHDERIRHTFVEIRDPSRGHALVTVIEIASPTNKLSGPDRKLYLRKQREVLDSDANLVEVDLLRAGGRLQEDIEVTRVIAELDPRPDYLVTIDRAWRRSGRGTAVQIFPCTLRNVLPCFPVPLRESDPEPPLDLQHSVNTAYDSGPYRRGAIDYGGSTNPPLGDADRAWASERLEAWTR